MPVVWKQAAQGFPADGISHMASLAGGGLYQVLGMLRQARNAMA